MRAAARSSPAWPLLFLGMVTAVYAGALAIVDRLPTLQERAGVVAAALTLDLVVGVPLAFYLLVVRRRGLPIVTLVPVLVLSGLAASRVLPDDRQQTLHVLEALALPLEIGLIVWIGWRATRAIRDTRADATLDPLERLRRAGFAVTRNDRAAAVVASEAAVFLYAFGSWRARPHAPAGSSPFRHHVRSGHLAIVLAFLLMLLVEGLAVHVLLLQWSVLAAWIFTAGTAYGALWLIADYRATVLRPILVGDESIVVRAGFRCTVQVPLARVAGVSRDKPPFGKESANLTFLGTPTRWLTFTEPVIAEGPYGFRRRVRAVGIAPDAPEDFDRTIGR